MTHRVLSDQNQRPDPIKHYQGSVNNPQPCLGCQTRVSRPLCILTMNPPSFQPRDEEHSRRRSSAAHTAGDDGKQQHKYDSPFDASLAQARKRAQQEKLWEMFATYALHMSSEDPTHMRVNNVIKLLQDCGVIDSSSSEEAKLIEKEIKIVCDSFLKQHPSDRDNTKRMDFSAFLALLMHFAQMSGDQDPTRAYDSLVRTCLEKQPKPRVRTAVTKEMQECKQVLQAFEDPLSKLFSFYAMISHGKLEKVDRKMAQQSVAHMCYAECLVFARRYGIIAHGVLTTTEFATIYIDSLPKAPANETGRVLTLDCFYELLVRLSRKACAGDHLGADRKLKGLFQLMWLASSSMSPRTLKITDVLKTDKVDVTKQFLLHFEKFWKKERYENYVGDRVGSSSLPPAVGGHEEQHIVLPPGSPHRVVSRRLSLCVQTTAAITTDGNAPTSPQRVQRRFSLQTPPQ